jgi:ferredoxin-NADP reductase
LTAPDGYVASRSYSVASAPSPNGEIDLTVVRLDGGEVSTFLHDVVRPGDDLEIRGPIGGWFVWEGTTPALLVGGGSGIVPLMAMLRVARAAGGTDLVHLVASVRSPADLLYADELVGPDTTVVFTRQNPALGSRPLGRLRLADLPAGVADVPRAYVCGSSGFADHATRLLIEAGLGPSAIRVERFGPSSGAPVISGVGGA